MLEILSPVISWPCCTAPAILSHLSICCFYFKFREGLVFPEAYLLFLTRLKGLITKKSTSSSQPCASYVTLQTLPRSSCIAHSSHQFHWQLGFICPTTRQVGLTPKEICKITSTTLVCFNEMDFLYCSFKFANTAPLPHCPEHDNAAAGDMRDGTGAPGFIALSKCFGLSHNHFSPW